MEFKTLLYAYTFILFISSVIVSILAAPVATFSSSSSPGQQTVSPSHQERAGDSSAATAPVFVSLLYNILCNSSIQQFVLYLCRMRLQQSHLVNQQLITQKSARMEVARIIAAAPRVPGALFNLQIDTVSSCDWPLHLSKLFPHKHAKHANILNCGLRFRTNVFKV